MCRHCACSTDLCYVHHSVLSGGRALDPAPLYCVACNLRSLSFCVSFLFHCTAGRTVSDACLEEVSAFKVDRATNINKDPALGALCASMMLHTSYSWYHQVVISQIQHYIVMTQTRCILASLQVALDIFPCNSI